VEGRPPSISIRPALISRRPDHGRGEVLVAEAVLEAEEHERPETQFLPSTAIE
jgi:hypothetical protein